MRLLLDTHAWLWLQVSPQRFSEATLELLSDVRNELLLSAASCWEIALKYALGKLLLPLPPAQYVPSRMERSGTTALPIIAAHALRVADLPAHHRDPFDRLLVAQAQHERVSLVTADDAFVPYDVELIRA
jgi:PIN domain nuclease of toxin-antitoxin system